MEGKAPWGGEGQGWYEVEEVGDTTLQREQGFSTYQGQKTGNSAEGIILAGLSLSWRRLHPFHLLWSL